MAHQKTFPKKKLIFLAPIGRYQDFRHNLQNPKHYRNLMGSNNHNFSHKFYQYKKTR